MLDETLGEVLDASVDNEEALGEVLDGGIDDEEGTDTETLAEVLHAGRTETDRVLEKVTETLGEVLEDSIDTE